MKKGLIQVYTGNGKGKTTAAIGQAIRAMGRGWRIMVVFWLKGERTSGEMEILKKLGAKVIFWGEEYGKKLITGKPVGNKDNIKKEAKDFLNKIKGIIEKERYDLLIMDEINVALHYGFIEEKEILDFLKEKPSSLELILTGRKALQSIICMADLVTEVKKIKHPYNSKIKARGGIEY
ncbi:MAG TPA: cob(I)yrinic acid a,c-diamide adenosyltransferase [Candidatus Aerophobetes bacterium]|uniref:Cob(I)yrinic acid a,c-diamide adenosyltransferase n=1 Tax=Aerophobetes bacterium TaxID=2030807 RepID=A0A7V5LZS7_UNCAE|nr:cob(I)yrinic acid a,c-diamide adenosyltransferase [Candidatus Aerophobetes bacterium]